MPTVELLNFRQINHAVTHLIVVAILPRAIIAVAHTVAAIQVANVFLALLGMHSSPVAFTVGAIGIFGVVLLNDCL